MEILDFENETCLTPITRNLLASLTNSAFHKVCIVDRILSYMNIQVTRSWLGNNCENIDNHVKIYVRLGSALCYILTFLLLTII